MLRTLIFETFVQDTLKFEGGKIIPAGTSFPLFTSSDTEIGNRVTDIHEEPVIKFFMKSRASGFLFDYLQLPSNSFFAFSVKEPVRKNFYHPDFDLLLCEADKPKFSTAIQFKRVKVIAKNDDEDKVNKLESVGEVVTQANIQRNEYGFHQNYLALIIQTFGENRTSQNVLFRHPSEQTFKEIYDFPQRDTVHEDVGIIFIKITQPTTKDYREKVSVGVCFDRLANRLSQTDNLTNRITEFIHSYK